MGGDWYSIIYKNYDLKIDIVLYNPIKRQIETERKNEKITMENINESWIVYHNVLKYMKRNSIVSDHQEMNVDKFISEINTNEFIAITGTRTDYFTHRVEKLKLNMQESASDTKEFYEASKKVIIFIASPTSKYANRSPNFRELMDKFLGAEKKLKQAAVNSDLDRYAQQALFTDVIFISKTEISSHIKKIVAEMNNYTCMYLYNNFKLEIPAIEGMPEHRYASAEEVHELIYGYYKTIDTMPKIHASDPAIIWLGARTGDIIRIIRPSESAGYSIAYRYVK